MARFHALVDAQARLHLGWNSKALRRQMLHVGQVLAAVRVCPEVL